MSKGIFGNLFDLNRNGNVDSWERAIEMMVIEGMDDEERREALEDAGIDPDDFDFY